VSSTHPAGIDATRSDATKLERRAPAGPAAIDRTAVGALAAERLGWSDKAVPPGWWGRTVADVRAARPGLSELPTPVLTLSEAALRHNLATMARWSAERGLDLAPHGKTTMAPALWAAQLEAGAWAITVANPAQLAVARAFGVSRVLVANQVVAADALRWIQAGLTGGSDVVSGGSEVVVWADSVRGVELMNAALDPAGPPLDVLVEVGADGGRSGARDRRTAVEVARAVAAAPALRLAGVAGYEGILARDASAAGLDRVRSYLTELVAVHTELGGLYPSGVVPIVSAGGSAYFDQVAEVLGPLATDRARVVVRSGTYLTHDDGLYDAVSPLGRRPRTTGERLRPALHAWARVLSQPEPGLALLDAGRRDVPYDSGLPEPQLVRQRRADLTGATVDAVNDQHAYLRYPPDGEAPVQVGDVVRLGVSHPCTAFDKWGLIPVIDDASAPAPVVVDLIRTFF